MIAYKETANRIKTGLNDESDENDKKFELPY